MSRKIILTVDGGGVRCIIPALILVELEKRLWNSGKRQGLHRYVDLFAGSAIGALIAAALCCPHPDYPDTPVCTPQEIVDLFCSPDHFVFDHQQAVGAGLGPYPADAFEARLKALFGAETVLSDALSLLLIPAYDLLKRQPVMMGNLCASMGNLYIWQALRGACAVPNYFAPAMVENRALLRPRGTPLMPLINGGSLAHDPSMAAYVEACKLGWNRDGNEIFILSLGTGLDSRPIPYFRPENSGNHGLAMTTVTPRLKNFAAELDTASPFQLNALLNADETAFNGTHTRLTARNRRETNYFRLNGVLQQASSDVEDVRPENIRALVGEATRFIEENSMMLDEVVERLG